MFSIVIPTYNRKDLIKRAVDSVFQQTYKEWELIISDDASSDGTYEYLSEIYKKEEKIKVVQSKSNKGNAAARNLGIESSVGEYICFLDSDDTYEPNFLATIKYLIDNHNKPGFLWCNVRRVSVDKKITNNVFPANWKPLEEEYPYKLFLKGLKFGTDFGLTVKRKVFTEIGMFDEKIRTAVDTDFILRLVKNKVTFYYSDEILVNTFDHFGPRVRRNIDDKLKAYNVIIEKHPLIKKVPDIYDFWLYKIAWMNYQVGNKKEARRNFNQIKQLDLKRRIVKWIYELFPSSLAIEMHKKFSRL